MKSRVVTSRRSISKHRDRSEGLSVTIPLSILDLAPIRRGQTASDSFAASVALAQRAEELGYRRVWYAEHHNMATIASSATSVIIAHIAAHTRSIRLGAGGIMLPNHSPLTIAEQFGTLESLHPGRIDLGLGRAPGADRNTMRALRRDPRASDTFPDDVLELQAYLAGESLIPGVDAIPGNGTKVPLYILGSSLFGAQLAASLGLPYAFASHFAPDALQQAVALYRREFVPSAQLSQPYVIAGLNVVAADTSQRPRSSSSLHGATVSCRSSGGGAPSLRTRRTSCSPLALASRFSRCSLTPQSVHRSKSGRTWRASSITRTRTSS